MGYRSTVGVYFNRTDRDAPSIPEMLALAKTQGVISGDTFGGENGWDVGSYGWNDDAFVFYVEDVKWYDTYLAVQEVEALVEFFDKANDNEGRFVYGGKFCRIGEESDDVEDRYIGDGGAWEHMYISRSITFDDTLLGETPKSSTQEQS